MVMMTTSGRWLLFVCWQRLILVLSPRSQFFIIILQYSRTKECHSNTRLVSIISIGVLLAIFWTICIFSSSPWRRMALILLSQGGLLRWPIPGLSIALTMSTDWTFFWCATVVQFLRRSLITQVHLFVFYSNFDWKSLLLLYMID